MKRTDHNYKGRYTIKVILPKSDGMAECVLERIDNPEQIMELSSVNPAVMSKAVHVDLWQDGMSAEIELTMKDGAKQVNYIQGFGLA